MPDFEGGSIANLPSSILAALASSNATVEHQMLGRVRPEVLDPEILRGSRVVVMLVLDGLGQESLRWAASQGALSYLHQAPHSSTLTSIFPSTTAAALTSLQTGLAPVTHGMAGYSLYLPAQQATINMIGWKPVGGLPARESLPQAKAFLRQPTFYDILERSGIPSTVVSNLAYVDSALTNVQSPDVPFSGYRTAAEFCGLLLHEVEKPGPRFVFGYWDSYDVVSHTHGPESSIALDELHLLDRAIGRGFLDRLSSGYGDVTVIVTADHGHTPISVDHTYSLKSILRRHSPQRLIPTGDRRAMGLPFDDPDALHEVIDLMDGNGVLVPVNDAIASGLYGPGRSHPELEERIGKTLLLARDDASFVFPQSNHTSAGGHGSLTAREMLVPLSVWRFY